MPPCPRSKTRGSGASCFAGARWRRCPRDRKNRSTSGPFSPTPSGSPTIRSPSCSTTLRSSAALSEPPPPELGAGADRVGLIVFGEDLGASADPFWKARVFFSLPEDAGRRTSRAPSRRSFGSWRTGPLSARARHALSERTAQIQALLDVGIALSAERDPDRLLELILSRARGLTQADAGSLYLVEPVSATATCCVSSSRRTTPCASSSGRRRCRSTTPRSPDSSRATARR